MFGPDAYKAMLRTLQNAGYSFVAFGEAAQPGDILLRHDIDFCVEDALQLATIEAEVGVSSIYFFMLTTNTYNLLSQHNSELVRKIAALGHRISIHFDPIVYADMDAGFEQERRIFEANFATKVDVVSIHRPGPFLDDNNRQLPGCRHSYEDVFFKQMQYLSDSAGRDIGPAVDALIAEKPAMPLHLLIHPIWWTSVSDSPSQTLHRWLARQQAFLIEETKRNCKTFEA